MRSSRRTTPHVAENSLVDPLTNACAFLVPFRPIHPPASAVHTMKARGNDDDDEDSNESNNSNDKMWDKDEDKDDEQ